MIKHFRFEILLLASLWSFVVVVGRQSFGHPETRWLHDRPDYAVGLLAAMWPETDDSWLRDLQRVALREYNFRRAVGIKK